MTAEDAARPDQVLGDVRVPVELLVLTILPILFDNNNNKKNNNNIFIIIILTTTNVYILITISY